MKKRIQYLITLSLPLILVNCSSKPQTKQLPQVNTPQTIDIQQEQTPPSNNPNLGRVISIPTPVTIERTTPTQTLPQMSEYGKTYVREKFKLANKINETSGLIKIDNRLWTHNDSGDSAKLYQIDERNGRVIRTVQIKNAKNRDWEDIAYDETYVYIGDTGNNRGNRRDLKIYKIPRAALQTQKSVHAEVIHYRYSDQKSFKNQTHKHNFDCEAMIAHNDKLYLFSKNWDNHKTRLYELSTTPGEHWANYIATFNINGLVTAAAYNNELDILLLTTYHLLDVNVWAFSQYNNRNFFTGKSKRLNIQPLQGQVEGITFTDNFKAYLSSESFRKYIFSFDAKLYEIDFSGEFE